MFLEARGGVTNSDERRIYQLQAVSVLQRLASDAVEEVSQAAIALLTKCVHPYLFDSAIIDEIFNALLPLSPEALQPLRAELSHLRGLFIRVSDEVKRQRIEELQSRLPALDALSVLQGLLEVQPWEVDDEERKKRNSRMPPAPSMPAGSWTWLSDGYVRKSCRVAGTLAIT